MFDAIERKLVTIREISAIDPIENADAIDVCTIDGWRVVVKKNEFNVGDKVVYFEIDSWIPETIAPFLFKGRSYNGIPGERLKTVRLRKQISQGLVLPMSVLYENGAADLVPSLNVDDDVTALLGVQKWEKPLSANLAGVARGNFPSKIRKTDQNRITNIKKSFDRWVEEGVEFECTEKLDGSSMTVYFMDEAFGVCSRNLDLMETEGNAFWEMANELDLRTKMTNLGRNIAIQGELVGNIQGNKYGLSHNQFFLFDIFDIDKQCYVGHDEREELRTLFGLNNAPHVPYVAGGSHIMSFPEGTTVFDVITAADGPSVIGNKSAREGLVFKSVDGTKSFKSISAKWLIKYDE